MSTPATPAQRLVTVAFLVLIAAAGMSSLKPPPTKPATAPATEFSAERAMPHIEVIAREPHPMGSPANDTVRDYLVGRLEAMGLRPDVQPATVPDYFGINQNAETVTLHNVMSRLPGTQSGKAIALVGHYDSVPAAPGACDDGCAVAAILETARALLAGPQLRNDVILLFTDGEEPGQYRFGARAFVAHHEWATEIALVLNFEASGCQGPSILFETGPDNGRLIREFGLASPYPTAFSYWNDLYKGVAKGGTDFSVFEEAGITGLNFAFSFDRTVYHTALDNVDHVSPRSLQHHGEHALALARHFGESDLEDLAEADEGDAVYFSLIGRSFVHYPTTWALPLTSLAGLILAGIIVIGFRKEHLCGSHLVVATLGCLLSVVAMVVLLSVAWWAIDRLHLAFDNVMEPTYQAHFYWAGFLCLVVAMVSAVNAFVGRNAHAANSQTAVLLWWWILALFASLYSPGFSYLFTWPLLGSLLARLWICCLRAPKTGTWGRVAILTLGGAPGLLLVVPAAYSLFQALGVPSPGFSGSPSFPIIGLSLFFWVMLVGLLRPSIEMIAGGRKWRPVGVMLLLAISFLVVASLFPGISIEQFGLSNHG